MGKVIKDNSLSDEAVLAQWVFRKLRNHNPMSERDSSRPHPQLREKERQRQLSPTSNTVRYALNNGSVFEITVTKVETALPSMAVAYADD